MRREIREATSGFPLPVLSTALHRTCLWGRRLIISHRHKFIFIKTRKTAGTSIEVALSKFLGPEDIVTPISPDEGLRQALGYVGPQNYLRPVGRPSNRAAPNGKPVRSHDFYNHIPAGEIKRRLDPSIWCKYLKFSAERNPWDLAVSLFYWRNHAGGSAPPSFRQFILDGSAYMASNFELYSIQGIPVIDGMLRHETLARDATAIGAAIGLPEDLGALLLNIRAKSGYRPTREYRHMYDEETKEIIALQFAREIKFLDYTF